MFCRFEGPPLIVRLYGQGRAVLPDDEGFDDLRRRFPADVPAVRSVIHVALDQVATSCGYGVPFMTFDAERDNMRRWAERKGPEGVVAYRAQRNTASIDGLPGLPGLDLHAAEVGRATA